MKSYSPANGDSFEEALDRHADKVAANCGSAVNWLAVLVCLIALIPGLGIFAGVAVFGPFALVGSVLAIIQMTKGRVSAGLWNLVAVWLLVPLLMILLQVIGLNAMDVLPELGKQAKIKLERAETQRAAQARYDAEKIREDEARDILQRSGWAQPGVAFSSSVLESAPVVYATFPAAAGGDVWRFDFDQDNHVLKIISTKEGEKYRRQ